MIENKLVLTNDQNELISFIHSEYFPWYYQKATRGEYYTFSHTLMERQGQGQGIQKPGKINSEFYYRSIDIFNKFCKENDVHVNGVLRAAFNNTTYKPEKWGDIHIDHRDIDHYNFIFYINDSSGNTFLFDDSRTQLIKEFVFEKNKGVIFKGAPHAQGFCNPYENRIILVVTFY